MNIPNELLPFQTAIQRLPTEPADAYQAFLHYVGTHGKTRSYEASAKALGFTEALGRTWSSQQNWAKRAAVVDSLRWIHDEQIRREACRKDNEKFASANREIKAKSQSIARKMLTVAENLLTKAEISEQIKETGMVETKDGRTLPTYTTIIMKSKVSDIPRLVDSAVKTSRLAAELPTEILTDGTNRLPTSSELAGLSIEEIEAMRADNRSILAKKGAIQQIGADDLLN